MLKIAEASLISCITAAVLAFGGTEPISFALIEVVLLGAAAVVVFRSKNYEWAGSWSLAAIPAGLIALVALQLLPLPRGFLRWLRPDYPAWDVDAAGGGGGKFFSLSIAPYNTKPHFILLVCCVVAFFFARMLGQDRASRRRLMTWLLDEARSAGHGWAFLEVRPSNRPAILLYESLAFAPVGLRHGYYQAVGGREDAVVYRLDLDAWGSARERMLPPGRKGR